MSEIKTIQLHEETYNELLKHKNEKQSFDDVLREFLEVPSSVGLEKQIEDGIKQGKADRKKWKQENLEEAAEIKKREHLFDKFSVARPPWMHQPGVTKIVFDGKTVTFSRKGCTPLTFEDIKKCDLSADNRTIKRDGAAPFEITTKYIVKYAYAVCTHGKTGVVYHDGTEMSIVLNTPEQLEEEEQQEAMMREELGC